MENIPTFDFKTLYPSIFEKDNLEDIHETPEMTEEAEEMFQYFFRQAIRALGPDNFKVTIRDDGGIFVTFKEKILYISGGGDRFKLYDDCPVEGVEDPSITYYDSFNKEEMADVINKELDLLPENDEIQDTLPPTDETVEPPAGPVVIKLKKGLDQPSIRKLIKDVDTHLSTSRAKKNPPSSVTVTTEDWDRGGTMITQHFVFINAAKKMFARYAEEGLLAVLIFNGFTQAAHNLYCIAYVKGKMKKVKGDDGVVREQAVFSNVSQEDFKKKLLTSSLNFNKYSTINLKGFLEGFDGEDAGYDDSQYADGDENIKERVNEDNNFVIDEGTINLVMAQYPCTRADAERALRKNKNDVVNAIMGLQCGF